MKINLTQLCHLDQMNDDNNILARCISIWKSHPLEKPNEVWNLDVGNRVQATIKGNISVSYNFYWMKGHVTELGTTITRVGSFDNNLHGFKLEHFTAFTARKFTEIELCAEEDHHTGGCSDRSSSKLSCDQTSNPTSSTNPTPKSRIRRSSKQKVENSNFEENPLPPEIPMAANQTMTQLLQAPTDGYEDAIVIPEIVANNFELKHDSLNSAVGGNFLDKIPADCLKIIESKSKVRQTRAKAVVSKVNSNSSTPAVSSDVAELKDMVRALLLEKKNQYSAQTSSHTPAPIK
nr:replication protein A 70 kDa DNA-binding subunit B [Tanacetum cinerariifolium]